MQFARSKQELWVRQPFDSLSAHGTNAKCSDGAVRMFLEALRNRFVFCLRLLETRINLHQLLVNLIFKHGAIGIALEFERIFQTFETRR